jgi:hypothetical protein
MPSSTEPRGGLKSGWALGESGWNADMEANLLLLSRLAVPNLYVIDRTLTAPPGSPVAGEAHIPAATATGAWAGKEGQIAIWSGSAWVFYPAKTGWLCVVTSEGTSGVLITKIASGWSTGIAL